VYAKNFMTGQGRKAFKIFNPGYLARGLNYVRPKIIDDYVTERLKMNPTLKVILSIAQTHQNTKMFDYKSSKSWFSGNVI